MNHLAIDNCKFSVGSRCKAAIRNSFAISFWLLTFSFWFSTPASAQEVTATLKADSSHIIIGDYLNVKLAVKFPSDFLIVMPAASDTIGNMELVKTSKIDTASAGNFKILSQIYTVSAYDSGKYHAGPLKIIFKNKSGIIDSVYSDSVLISVTTIPVDTTKAFKAIKAPLEVPYTFSEFLPYIIAALALIAIIIALVYYVRKRRKKKPLVIEKPKPKDPAHVWARKELKKLEEEKLWQKDEIKLYYSRLTDILRLYLEYRYNWFALEATTEEITDEISSYQMPEAAQKNLLMILTEADLVKFAKKIPWPDANMKAMELAYQFIDITETKEVKSQEKANV